MLNDVLVISDGIFEIRHAVEFLNNIDILENKVSADCIMLFHELSTKFITTKLDEIENILSSK